MKHLYLIIISSAIFFHSCQCSNSHESISYYGYSIKPDSKTVIAKPTGVSKRLMYVHTLSITPLKETNITPNDKKGRCTKEGNIVTFEETISDSTLSIYCDHNLYHYGITFKKGENLLKHTDTFELYNRTLLIKVDSTKSGTYTYYISGNTSLGNTFLDSTMVTYE